MKVYPNNSNVYYYFYLGRINKLVLSIQACIFNIDYTATVLVDIKGSVGSQMFR
jgi:hypothetical protein